MSRDIRSFFAAISKKQSKTELPPSTKKRPIIVDSSDEEIIEASPIPLKNKINNKSKKRKVINSDSEDENKKPSVNKSNTKKSDNKKRVSAADIFGSTPIKQSKVEKQQADATTSNTQKKFSKDKPKLETELGIHDDPNFEQSLLDIDDDILLNNVDMLEKTIENTISNKATPMSSTEKEITTPKTYQKRKIDDNSEIDNDEERYEKKRHSAMLYQKYLNRSGPVNHGMKEYPKGKPDCLKGLCFLRTGVLDSLEGEEFEELIKGHGGRTVQAVSKKVNFIVVGVDAGPAKLEKARNYGISNISEDELLDLILTKSGMPKKYTTKPEGDKKEEQKSSDCDEKYDKTLSTLKKISPVSEKKVTKKSPEKKFKTQEITKPSLEKLQSHTKQNDTKSDNKEKKVDEKKKIPTEKKSNDKIEDIKIKKENFYGDKEKQINNKKEEAATQNQENLSWADKYKPISIKNIIGQQEDNSNMKRLLFWLSRWHANHLGKNKPKLVKPSLWAKGDDGAYFKCALLSGPPGIGKTTTATLVAKELGYDIVEFNASDTRSKKLLHEEVAQLLSTRSITSFMKDGSAPTKKHVLLMDEVDGMAGNEDRGGMQELIALIKSTNIPIICMCNDRNHQKMRSLVNYCFDLRFTKPRMEKIRGFMMTVCCREGLKISPEAIAEIINGTDLDIRQTLNNLSLWTINKKNLSVDESKREAASAKKDQTLGPWEVIRKVFAEKEQKTMSIADKFRLFFYDYSIGPLFVQENYLQVQPHCQKQELLQRVADTADAISVSDLVDRKMRSSNNWSLLEVQAIFSSVLPGHYMSGHFKGQINFPGWLGKNSKKGKIKRLISELQSHTRMCTSASRKSVNLDYVYHWRNNLVNPLKEKGTEGIEDSLGVMHSYNLLRQDLDSILEVSHWSRQKDPMAMVNSRVKTAFTKAYNKENIKLPYAVSSAFLKKKTPAALIDNPYDEEEVESSAEDDDITKDAMIKTTKPPKGKTTDSEASSSKKTGSKGGGKGKGKGSKKTK